LWLYSIRIINVNLKKFKPAGHKSAWSESGSSCDKVNISVIDSVFFIKRFHYLLIGARRNDRMGRGGGEYAEID
jgi:hypothetical protein